MSLIERLRVLGRSGCLLAIALVTTGSGCEERTPPSPKARELRRRPPPTPAQDTGDVASPLVSFPAGMSAETRKLAARLDTHLRYPGSLIWRVANFLRYPSSCKTVTSRYQKLTEEISKKSAARRATFALLKRELAGVDAARQSSLWRWFDTLRAHLEDEIGLHSQTLAKAADRFVRACPKQTAEMVKLSTPLGDTQFRLLGELHDLAALEATGSKGNPATRDDDSFEERLPKGSKPLVPLPKGLTAESRSRALGAARCVGAGLQNIRRVGAMLGAGDCAAVRRRFEQEHEDLEARNRTTSRTCLRRLVLLTRVNRADVVKIKAWHGKLGSALERELKKSVVEFVTRLRRFARLCPRDLKLVRNVTRVRPGVESAILHGVAEALTQAAKRRRSAPAQGKIHWTGGLYWPSEG